MASAERAAERAPSSARPGDAGAGLTGTRPLADPLFRRLWLGEALASVSEQLFLVCLTLLVLDVAGAGTTLGLVLAVAAVPRAVLLPLGGLLADRVPPVRLVVVSTALRTATLGALAALVLFGRPSLVLIAALAGLLGVLDAFYYPASLTLLPRVVPPAGLTRANALVQGAESAGDLFGPALAAGLVAVAGLGGALSAVVCLYLLATIALVAFARRFGRRVGLSTRARSSTAPPDESSTHRDTARPAGLAGLVEGVRYALGEPVVRGMLLVIAVLNVAVVGPIMVGGAVLAEQRLGGAAMLGLVFTGFGIGSAVGLLAAGARPPKHRGAVCAGGTATIGIGLAGLGMAPNLAWAIAVCAVIGVGAAYLGVVLVAWLQELVPVCLSGRVMSLVALAAVALDPLSFALAGALLPAGLPMLFGACGALVLVAASIAALSTRSRLPTG
ncbi:tetracycline efflux MFS transporter Tet(V) [Pseudonocardia eucalypti]|uniref:Tetracycline efflux MFS transporter Tet(V) n=1 Tax=Pseudonocardia eucalypti TaxID=648755 RepID=A0ABP9PZX3_9PSEU|nr:MFS family permease [Pseudonocardia eucalypti]